MMNDKINYCPKCNAKLNIIINGRDYIVSCSKCDYKVVTTNTEDIDLDSTIYFLSILPNNEISLENIKLISKLTAKNYINSKRLSIQGEQIFTGYAIEVFKVKKTIRESENKI